MSCGEPPSQKHGHRDQTQCAQTYIYRGTCQYACDPGYLLDSDATSLLTCIVETINNNENIKWDKSPSDCKGNTKLYLLHYY